MDKAFLETMHERLNQLKSELIQNLVSESQDFEAIIKDLDPKDLADIAADDIDRKTLEVLSSQDIKRLRQIESAIARINNGNFGVCPSCGKKISKERLEAIPYAFLCISCKTADERKNR